MKGRKLRVLWIPKSWKSFGMQRDLLYYGSNRLRAFNIHQYMRAGGLHRSDLLGAGRSLPLLGYDIVVFQKIISHRLLAVLLKLLRRRLVALDACDPIKLPRIRQINMMADAVICSSRELRDDLVSKGLSVPSFTVVDPHEADPGFLKEHVQKEKVLVTWYGMPENYFKFIQPLQPFLDHDAVDFRWASSEEPELVDRPGFVRGIVWDLPKEEAWRRPDSWQRFIQSSDIGIVPVSGHIKSFHKVLNYMAYGIPVVCSPTDAHRRIIRHGVNGFFAEDEAEWVKYISLLQSPEIRAEIGLNARRAVLDDYSVESLAGEYVRTLLRCYHQKVAGK